MRLYAVVALADNRAQQIVDAIDRLWLVRRREWSHPHLIYRHSSGTLHDIIAIHLRSDVSLPVNSNAPSGLWDVYLLVGDSRGRSSARWTCVARLIRKLIRERQGAAQGWVLGPWSVAEFTARWPSRAEALLGEGVGWPVIYGDTRADVVSIDYRPTADDVDDDTDLEIEEEQ